MLNPEEMGFKIGSRVKIIRTYMSGNEYQIGDIGTIIFDFSNNKNIRFENGIESYVICHGNNKEIELLPTPIPKFKIGDKIINKQQTWDEAGLKKGTKGTVINNAVRYYDNSDGENAREIGWVMNVKFEGMEEPMDFHENYAELVKSADVSVKKVTGSIWGF